tara:strand:+ start:116 stop:361 length:246 start_codon:yes stop_codon:yes gene_type:complete
VTADGVNYGDWYLPSKYELNLMYENIGPTIDGGNVGNFSNEDYWSSTEYDNEDAWTQYFWNGDQWHDYKNSTYAVRAVRAF